MASAPSQWLLTTVNAVRELMVGRLHESTLDPASRRDLEMAIEELDVMWDELQGQAELLLRENRRYTEFFEYAPDAYLVTDAGGNIREANRAAVDLLHTAREALVRRPLADFVAPANRTAFLSRFVGLLVHSAGKDAWEGRIAPPAAEELRVLFTVRAIPLGKSGVSGLCWLIRPVD